MASVDVAIEVKRVSKSFRLPHERRTMLKEYFLHPLRRTQYEQNYALRDVSFAIEQGEFFGIIGPAGMPPELVRRLNAEINRALQSPELRARLTGSDNVPTGGTAAAFAQQIRTEHDANERIVKAAGIKAE